MRDEKGTKTRRHWLRRDVNRQEYSPHLGLNSRILTVAAATTAGAIPRVTPKSFPEAAYVGVTGGAAEHSGSLKVVKSLILPVGPASEPVNRNPAVIQLNAS